MYPGACLLLAFLLTAPALAQVTPEASGGSGDDSQMMTPPPVSGQAYPSEVGAAARTNYLRAGLTFSTAYVDNLYLGSATTSGETTYTVLPTIAYDQTTTRQHRVFTYSPGFTFYQPSSALNDTDQSLNASYQYRLTEHTSVSASDNFERSSTTFSSASSADGSISGAPPTITPGIVAPFAERLTNSVRGQFSFQFSQLGMVGASGSLSKLSYPNPGESTGLYNSNQRGAGGFFNRRISGSQYAGVNYEYSRVISSNQGQDSQTQTHTIDAFYTIAPKRNLSISVSGGPQYYTVEQAGIPSSGSWGPSVSASMGWQEFRTNLAASYSRQVTGGGGLLGVFQSTSANASAGWQLTKAWLVSTSVNYSINKSITPLAFTSTQGGHTISGTATAGRPITQQIHVQFEYDRLHQSYGDVAAIAGSPNSNREQVSLTWQFTRPLGR
jgi:hypothetical protein